MANSGDYNSFMHWQVVPDRRSEMYYGTGLGKRDTVA